MSEQPAESVPPQWDLADRMRKALRASRMSPGEMAEYLRVGGNTVSTWINGKIEPSDQTVRLWALRTGTPFTWLCHGDMQPCDLRPRIVKPGGVSPQRTRGSNYMQSKLTVNPAA